MVVSEDGQKEKSKYLPEEVVFRRNAFILITTMVDLSKQTPQDTSMLVEEALHSVFFLGAINSLSLLDDNDKMLDFPATPKGKQQSRKWMDRRMLDDLKRKYPLPFQLYLTQLPRRSPFSCLLDMVVSLYGQENEDQIKDKLKIIVHQMKEGTNLQILFSSTICISWINSSSRRYYGVSLSTTGRPAGEILVASSCFSFWHRLVSDAVMTYYPDKQKKPYFSRNIKLPTDIKCEAFNISEGRPMDPCTSCSDLFGLDIAAKEKKDPWAHGSCAEVESLSNLFKGEQLVMEGLGPDENEQEDRLRAERRVINHLRNQLNNFNNFNWDGKFYPNLNPLNTNLIL